MSLQSMITGANLPMAIPDLNDPSKLIPNPDSLFKNPAQAGLDAFGISQGGMGGLSSAMILADPLFDPSAVFGAMTSATTGITSELTSKLSELGTQLPVAVSAAKIQEQVQSVDAIISGNASNIPNQIDNAFPPPGTCPIDYVKDSFKSVTEGNTIVEAGNDAVAANFDNTGAMSTLYSALNAIPGVVVTNGKELLETVNSGGAAVTAAVTAAITSSSALLDQLKDSFTSVQTTAVTSMTSAFDSVVADSAAAIDSAFKTITGGNVVNMINSSSPCIQSVMSAAINPVKVDQTSLTVNSAVGAKSIELPGSESVLAANTTAPITLDSKVNVPVVPATQMIAPVAGPAIDPYTPAELDSFQLQVTAAFEEEAALKKQNSDWYDNNIENWKIEVQFSYKQKSAGATDSNPVGTSTDPVVLAAWKSVYDVYKPKIDYYNTVLVPPRAALYLKARSMGIELASRRKFGKYPYTYQKFQGVFTAPDEQYTLLQPPQPK